MDFSLSLHAFAVNASKNHGVSLFQHPLSWLRSFHPSKVYIKVGLNQPTKVVDLLLNAA